MGKRWDLIPRQQIRFFSEKHLLSCGGGKFSFVKTGNFLCLPQAELRLAFRGMTQNEGEGPVKDKGSCLLYKSVHASRSAGIWC